MMVPRDFSLDAKEGKFRLKEILATGTKLYSGFTKELEYISTLADERKDSKVRVLIIQKFSGGKWNNWNIVS